MKFVVERASNLDSVKEVEINTLEELLQFIRDKRCDVIVGAPYGKKFDSVLWRLLIYDSYIE